MYRRAISRRARAMPSIAMSSSPAWASRSSVGIARCVGRRARRIDFVESNGEHWLEVEGRLRDDLGIEGLTAGDVRRLRSKLAMAEAFENAGVPSVPGIRCLSSEAVEGFAAKHGFPLVFKPDSGSGANSTFRVSTDSELEAALLLPLDAHVVQPFVDGGIVTFDGLVDRADGWLLQVE